MVPRRFDLGLLMPALTLCQPCTPRSLCSEEFLPQGMPERENLRNMRNGMERYGRAVNVLLVDWSSLAFFLQVKTTSSGWDIPIQGQ